MNEELPTEFPLHEPSRHISFSDQLATADMLLAPTCSSVTTIPMDEQFTALAMTNPRSYDSEAARTRATRTVLPLSSRRLTSPNLKALATMGIPTAASVDDLRLMIGGKLQEMDKEQQNVEVVLEESAGSEQKMTLRDEGGVFLEVHCEPTRVDQGRSTPDSTGIPDEERNNVDDQDQEKEHLSQVLLECRTELETAREALNQEQLKSRDLERELEAAKEETSRLQEELDAEKSKAQSTWRLHCEQLVQWDTDLANKDAVIEQLTAKGC